MRRSAFLSPGIFYRLPDWFRTDPKLKGEKLTPQQEDDQKRAVAARASSYDVHPFLTEWRYRITPPEGFTLACFARGQEVEMGPALLTQHYEQDAKGRITADLRFSTGKPHYTVDEALALRDAVLAAYKEDMITILFDQQGAKLMAAGRIREALAADHALIAQHPAQALQHAQMAYALLKAGMGDRARAEALQATQLDPKSAVAFNALGWVCQFNAIGIQFGQGFDWDCAAAAYKKALELDPDDSNNLINLAVSMSTITTENATAHMQPCPMLCTLPLAARQRQGCRRTVSEQSALRSALQQSVQGALAGVGQAAFVCQSRCSRYLGDCRHGRRTKGHRRRYRPRGSSECWCRWAQRCSRRGR
jgi:tetratricopeptide (TPR) repeat protein